MKTMLTIMAAVLLAAGVWPLLPADTKVELQSAVRIHNQQTMDAADKKATASEQATAASVQAVVESGKNVADAMKDIQNGGVGADDKLNRLTSAYLAAVESVQRNCDVYTTRLDAFKDETEAEDERWTDLIAEMKDSKMKADHQRLKDHRMQSLNKRLQNGRSMLSHMAAALDRASDVKLALASLQEDARVGALSGKVAAFLTQIKDTDTALQQAVAAILPSIDTHTPDVTASTTN